MNAYDFDKTLYPRDSTLEFYLTSLVRHPSFLLDLPMTALAFIGRALGRISTRRLREITFRSFRRIKDLDGEVERFWEARRDRIYPYYREQQRPDDVVISASPEFVLRPIARHLGFGTLIASEYDPKTGRYSDREGSRCHGEGKPPRFYALFPDAVIEEFYSDSLSDTPMARLAERAYLVGKGGTLAPWPEEALK